MERFEAQMSVFKASALTTEALKGKGTILSVCLRGKGKKLHFLLLTAEGKGDKTEQIPVGRSLLGNGSEGFVYLQRARFHYLFLSIVFPGLMLVSWPPRTPCCASPALLCLTWWFMVCLAGSGALLCHKASSSLLLTFCKH